MKEPVDHILRPSLPWRANYASVRCMPTRAMVESVSRPGDAALTECGYNATKVKTLTRPEFFQRLKDMGQQRCAILTCMTCSDTARRWGTWEDDPRKALDREIAWEWGGGYRARADRGDLLRQELVAIAALIEAHRDEFDAIMTANAQRREWLEMKAAKAVTDARKPPRPPQL